MSKARFAFVRAASLTLGTVAALAIGEAGARMIESRQKPGRNAAPRLALLRENPHGTGSYRLRPGLDVRTRVENLDVRIVTNSAGMHWRETPLEKPQGRRRIALLGDSFAFGCWARSVEFSFAGVLDRAVAPYKAEVLNFGVGGYGLEDQILIYEEEARGYQPDIVLVAAFVGNDLRDTWLGSGKERIADGVVELDPGVLARRVPARFLQEDDAHSRPADPRAWGEVAAKSAAFRLIAPLFDLDSPFQTFEPNRQFVKFNFWSRVPVSSFARDVMDHYVRRLEFLRDRVTMAGSRLAVLLVPTAEQVYAVNPVGPRHDARLPQSLLARLIGETGVPLLDPLDAWRRRVAASGEHLYLRTDSHLNEAGHRLLGETIGRWLLEEGLIARE